MGNENGQCQNPDHIETQKMSHHLCYKLLSNHWWHMIFHTVAAVNEQKHPNPNHLVYGYINTSDFLNHVNDQAILVAIYCPPNITPPKKKQMNTPFKLHKSCLAVFVPSISGSVFLGLETQGARCWTCLWNALEILGCQVKARKECQMVGCFETKNPGVLAWLTVSLYHFKLAYVMLKGHMSKFHTRGVG